MSFISLLCKSKIYNSLFGLIVILALFLGFYSNNFKAVKNNNDIQSFLTNSEFMVIGRIVVAEREGIFFKGGLVGSYEDEPENESRFTYQYRVYENDLEANSEKFFTYNSMIGGQAITFAILNKLLPFENSFKLRLFWKITALALAIIFTIILFWIKRKFGYLASFLTLLMIISSHWLTLFGKNMWWSLWSFYLPFISLLIFFEKFNNYKKPLLRLFIVAFLSMFVKCFFTGYEYITTAILMAACPLVYYSILYNWSFTIFFKKGLVFSAATLSSIFVSFGILILQIASTSGSFSEGVNHIIYSFKKRTHADSSTLNEVYKHSLDASITDVLQTYWNGVAFDFTTFYQPFWDSFVTVDFGELVVLFAFFSALLFWLKTKAITPIKVKQNVNALVITTWFSFAAPLSWFILFKSHSYIHTHMNFIVWFMPFAILGFAVISTCMSILIKIFVVHFNRIGLGYKLLYLMIPILFFVAYSLKGNQNEKLIDTLLSDTSDSTENGFKIYLHENEIWYINTNPSTLDEESRFFLHITPNDTLDLSTDRKIHGFDNLDFIKEGKELELPWWSEKRNFLIVSRKLPKYNFRALRTGQLDSSWDIIWETTLLKNK